ncbi:hypothetical protein DL765_007897 [Monosporascus sp. GIB2]|nr:hypothetical protein DL765_007897 [Monosporascus sp. GIB2]
MVAAPSAAGVLVRATPMKAPHVPPCYPVSPPCNPSRHFPMGSDNPPDLMLTCSDAPRQAIHYSLIAIAAAVIAARIYLRLRIQNRSLLLSDLLMIAAWCAAFTLASIDIELALEGVLEPHIDYTLVNYDVDAETLESMLKLLWASTIPFFTTFYLSKASLLATYLQLFPCFMVKRRILLWVTIGYCAGAYIATISLQLFLCFPIERNWAVTQPQLLCDYTVPETIFRVAWALHFFGNIVIFLLPLSLLHRLQMGIRTRLGVYGVFLLGIIDIAFSLTRFLNVHLNTSGGFRPFTLIAAWSALDVNMGVVVACLPSLRPYFRRNFKASYGNKYNKPSSTGSPTVRRPDQSKLKEIVDVPSHTNSGDAIAVTGGANAATALHWQSRHEPAGTPGFGTDDTWYEDRKSNTSDVELVKMNATPVEAHSNVSQKCTINSSKTWSAQLGEILADNGKQLFEAVGRGAVGDQGGDQHSNSHLELTGSRCCSFWRSPYPGQKGRKCMSGVPAQPMWKA